MHILVLDNDKDESIKSHTVAYAAGGAIAGILVLVAFVGIVVWKKKKNTKETMILNKAGFLFKSNDQEDFLNTFHNFMNSKKMKYIKNLFF